MCTDPAMNTTCIHNTTYKTDMTDAEWTIIEPYINQDPTIGSPRTTCMRCVVNALFYLSKTGCQWQMLPKDFPCYGTVYYHFRRWSRDGTITRMNIDLRRTIRIQNGRDPEPSLVIADSQSVPTTAVGGDVGFDGNKQIKGRKRHVVVDTLGLLLFVAVTHAGVQDANSGALYPATLRTMLPRVVKILVDQGYKVAFATLITTLLGWAIEVVSRPPSTSGFQVLPKRWIVERTFAWLDQYRRVINDYEYYTHHSQTMIEIASLRRMLKLRVGRKEY